MARYVASVDTPWKREDAFAYLADFATIADWDPGVASARRVAGEPLDVGALYEVRTSMAGREIPLVYEAVEVDAPRQVVLRAETAAVVSLDAISFDLRPGGGTVITYDADLRLKGPLRLLDPALGLAFRRIGDRARDGLRKRLAAAPPVAASEPG
jgi:hypothetical protein